ncbi:MAG TPA: hypothetical protein VKE74_28735 [Gemmataceae bacterium]|nr:hypothetical protein [Gemmataceae bacterium]
MRLWRNNPRGELAITVDTKPDKEHTDALKEEGFRWQIQDQAWTKPLDRDAKWRTQAEAETTFRDTGNAIRGAKGLEPVAQVGM